MRGGYVYLLSTMKNGTLYLGVTNNIHRRVQEHISKLNKKSFSAKYNVARLVWFEYFENISDAIQQEKNVKKYPRQWKINLIEKDNPEWREIELPINNWD